MYHCSRRLQATFWSRQTWVRFQKQPFCSKPPHGLTTYDESLKKLDKLDFLTAAKMLFTDPPKKKKFGLDFHLELEQKKKKQEEEKVEEIELNATKEKEARSVPELSEVRERLEKLEETVKGIAAETKKQTVNGQAKGHEGDSAKKSFGTEARTLSSSESSKPVEKDPLKQDSVGPRPAASKDRLTAVGTVPNASPEGKIQDGGPSQDAKR